MVSIYFLELQSYKEKNENCGVRWSSTIIVSVSLIIIRTIMIVLRDKL